MSPVVIALLLSLFGSVGCAQDVLSCESSSSPTCTQHTDNEVVALLQPAHLSRATIAARTVQSQMVPTKVVNATPEFKKVGMGQCVDSDGNLANLGWAQCVCDKPVGSNCYKEGGHCPSVDVCKAECEAHPECGSFNWYTGHCWLYKKMEKEYVSANEHFTWYECYVEGVEKKELIGCYADKADRDLPVAKDNTVTVEQCEDRCKGYKYFGHGFWGECYCGNTFGKYGPASDCDCLNPDWKNSPAASWKNCVYGPPGEPVPTFTTTTTTTAPAASSELIGCYVDKADRDLPVKEGNTVTVEQCGERCKGYKYFGHGFWGECYCGNTFGKYGPASGCECLSTAWKNSPASSWKNCVYSLK